MDASDAESTTTPPIVAPPSSSVPPPPSEPAPVPATSDIELTIAPLLLDPLPPIPGATGQSIDSPTEHGGVLGDFHLELPPLALTDPAPAAAPPAAVRLDEPASGEQAPSREVPVVPTPAWDTIDLKIEPLDMPSSSASSEIAAVVAHDASGSSPVVPPPVASAPPEPTAPSAPAPSAAPRSGPSPLATPAHELPPAPPAPTPVAPPHPVAEPAPTVAAAPASASAVEPTLEPRPTPSSIRGSGLPNDPVAADATPTTVVPEVTGRTPGTPSVSSSTAGPLVVGLPSHQPSQAQAPAIAAPAAKAASVSVPAQVSRKERKFDDKLKKQQQKMALQTAKANAKKQRSGGGLALFFTLLVLAGLIAGAIVFGKPYLFPDEWDEAARPYAAAVEAARGAEIAEPLVVQRRAADVFAVSMTDHVVGPWNDEMPTWRSLGLVSGPVDAPLLGRLVADWSTAYYSPGTGEVIANDATPAALVDAAITEAMAAAALDQESGWASTIDEHLLDASALTRGRVIASGRAAADATAFGAVDHSGRDIGVSTYLPPVLEYRVNAADVYAEFATDDVATTDNVAAFDALVASGQLQASSEPELVDGDVLTSSRQTTDRTFWYLVFASYTDARTAYSASNALVEASLSTADAAGTQCTYATFSGTDVAGTAQVVDVVEQWAANAPTELGAAVGSLQNGVIQLRTCDPGVGFESGARFGIGREIARLRTVELAAITSLPATSEGTVDRAAIIADVRASEVGLALLDLDFATTPAASAAQARTIVAATPVDE